MVLIVARPALPMLEINVEVLHDRYTAPWNMFPSCGAGGFQCMVTTLSGTRWHCSICITTRTVGASAVNHFASFDMSIELLQPVPEAIGELLEYTGKPFGSYSSA